MVISRRFKIFIKAKLGGIKMMYKTVQEEFWSGEFGTEYIDRNSNHNILVSDIAIFSEILRRTQDISSVIEFGSNIGMNLKAMKTLLPQISCSAIEINHKAADILRNDKFFDNKVNVIEESILKYKADKQYDFVLIKGVLIHINPNELDFVYQKLYDSANRYICICEYYNPVPVSVNYRGHEERLFKRDFAGEFMDKFSNCELVDYGFRYHRDKHFPMDDVNWFLLEKR